MDILFASGNEHKKQEMQVLLAPDAVHLPSEFGLSFECEETGSTFEENAIIKAKALYEVAKHMNMPVLADDSGLLVDALPGLLGVRTARFGSNDGEPILPAHDKNMLLIKMLEGKDKSQRGATFVCCLVLIMPDGRILKTEGKARGYILDKETGEFGFGYDPVFFNLEAGRPQAELQELKNTFGHRGKAVEQLKKLLKEEK